MIFLARWFVHEPPERPAQLARYAILAQLGIELAAPIGLGIFLDYHLRTAPWLTLAGIAVGFIGGMTHLFYLAARENRTPPGRDR